MFRIIRFFTSSIRRKAIFSFVIIIIFVVLTAIVGYYQLDQVRDLAAQIVSLGAQMQRLQNFALAISSLDANTERFFVIGGVQFRENIIQDLQDLADILQAIRENASPEMLSSWEALDKLVIELETTLLTLLESTNMTSAEINRGLVSAFSLMEDVGASYQALTVATFEGLQNNVLRQERIISNVSSQFLVLGTLLALIAIAASVFVTRGIVTPLSRLAETTTRIAAGDLEVQVPVVTQDEMGQLAQAFNSMTVQLRDLITGLEQRVAERTLALEQRSAYLEGSAEVGRAAASILDVDILIHQVVELIRERFDLYYVGLFLVEADADIGGADAGHADIGGADVAGGEWAVLRAGTGEAGRTMLARGHRLRVGTGMIGWSVANAEARIALDVGADAVHFDNPDLPNTHSEGALPLISRGRVLGALTVQSDQPDAFDAAAISVLQMMADQVAMALDNAQLLAASQTALEAERRAYGEISREAWRELLHTRTQWGYRYARQSVMPAERIERPEMLEAERTGQSVRKNGAPPGGGEEGATLVVPIKAFDEVIGTLRFCRSEMWGVEETALLETLTAQLSMALESARLHQDAQNRAAREQLTREITTRMRESLEVDTVLQTAVREIGDALGITKIKLRMSTR